MDISEKSSFLCKPSLLSLAGKARLCISGLGPSYRVGNGMRVFTRFDLVEKIYTEYKIAIILISIFTGVLGFLYPQ